MTRNKNRDNTERKKKTINQPESDVYFPSARLNNLQPLVRGFSLKISFFFIPATSRFLFLFKILAESPARGSDLFRWKSSNPRTIFRPIELCLAAPLPWLEGRWTLRRPDDVDGDSGDDDCLEKWTQINSLRALEEKLMEEENEQHGWKKENKG